MLRVANSPEAEAKEKLLKYQTEDTLEKQLELLSERSQNSNNEELVTLSHAMADVAQALISHRQI